MLLWKNLDRTKPQTREPIKKYAIECKNRGMWGFSSLLKSDEKTVAYDTKEEAQRKVDEIYSKRGSANNFTDYFVVEIEVDS